MDLRGGSTVVAAACLLLASCSDSPSAPRAADPPSAREAGSFLVEVQKLCDPMAERYRALAKARRGAEAKKASKRMAAAERSLADALREVEAPASVEPRLEAYADVLERFRRRYVLAAKRSGPPGRSLRRIVRATRVGVRLREVGEAAGIPRPCPPIGDVQSTLVVAEANFDCWRFSRHARAEARSLPDAPILDIVMARRVSASVRKTIRRATGPQGGSEFFRDVMRLEERRERLLVAIEKALVAGEPVAGTPLGDELVDVAERADKKLIEGGLVECVKAFEVALRSRG